MKLAELRETPSGTKMTLSLGGGWYQEVTYKRLVQVTKFGTIKFSDLMNGNFSLDKGKKVWEASIDWVDDKGKTKNCTVNPRRLRKEVKI